MRDTEIIFALRAILTAFGHFGGYSFNRKIYDKGSAPVTPNISDSTMKSRHFRFVFPFQVNRVNKPRYPDSKEVIGSPMEII